MPENLTGNSIERSRPFKRRHLIAGVALYSPNLEPSAITIPNHINFLYNLPQRPLAALAEDDRDCPVCGDHFVTDIPEGDDDIFHELLSEVPLVMSQCCHAVCGSHFLESWLDPFLGHNNCPSCHHDFFTKLEDPETKEGEMQLRRILDWNSQEKRRRINEGPEWREEAIKESEELEQAAGEFHNYSVALRAQREGEDRRFAKNLESNEGLQVMLNQSTTR